MASFIMLDALVNFALPQASSDGGAGIGHCRYGILDAQFLSIGSLNTLHLETPNPAVNPNPMEGPLHNNLKAIAAAVAVLSAPTLLSHPAEAGGAQAKTLSNPPKFASIFHVRKHRTAKPSTPITEYSSSSATRSKSKPNR